jgi:hypothetical protein
VVSGKGHPGQDAYLDALALMEAFSRDDEEAFLAVLSRSPKFCP